MPDKPKDNWKSPVDGGVLWICTAFLCISMPSWQGPLVGLAMLLS